MTSFLLSATDCWPMQDQISQMRIMFFARTGEKLQTAHGPWLVPLQDLAQGLVEASSFCELKDVFIKHYFKKYTQYLSEKCFAWNVHIPKSQKTSISPQKICLFPPREGRTIAWCTRVILNHIATTFTWANVFQTCCSNFLYIFWHCI